MKKLQIFLFIAITFFLSASASAQLRAYNFEYNDQHGGKQKCYLTLRGFDIAWDNTNANVLFNCYESDLMRERKVEPRKIFILTLKEMEFVNNVSIPVSNNDVGIPRAVYFSNMVWDLAETTKFIYDYSWSEPQQKMVMSKKSLIDLEAERIDVPLNALARGIKK